jgi:hypothetical protein
MPTLGIALTLIEFQAMRVMVGNGQAPGDQDVIPNPDTIGN